MVIAALEGWCCSAMMVKYQDKLERIQKQSEKHRTSKTLPNLGHLRQSESQHETGYEFESLYQTILYFL